MSDLIFAFRTTLPVFLVMAAGFLFRRLGWMKTEFVASLNRFVFLIPLPILLFLQLGGTDFRSAWDTSFVVFCFLSTLLSITLSFVLSYTLKGRGAKGRGTRGEFIQAAYRSSAAILGMAYIESIYGQSAMGPLMIIGAVPLYNMMAVVVLTLSSEEQSRLSQATIKRTLISIVTNPIILGIIAGVIWSLCKLPIPYLIQEPLSQIARTATPLGLLALGASIEPEKVRGEMKGAFLASFVKLILLEAIFLPLAVWLGFRGEMLVAILIMLGSPTTVTCYVMAKNMGHEGVLTSNAVVLTTVLSGFTLTFWIYLVKTMGLI